MVIILAIFLPFILLNLVTSQYQRKELSSNDIINDKVNRTIDISRTIIKVKTEVLIRSNKNDALNAYRHLIHKNSSLSLVHIEAQLKSTSEDEIIQLKISNKHGDTYDYYDLTFYSEPMNYEEERLL